MLELPAADPEAGRHLSVLFHPRFLERPGRTAVPLGVEALGTRRNSGPRYATLPVRVQGLASYRHLGLPGVWAAAGDTAAIARSLSLIRRELRRRLPYP